MLVFHQEAKWLSKNLKNGVGFYFMEQWELERP